MKKLKIIYNLVISMNLNKTHILLVHVDLQRCSACIIILFLNICPYNQTVIDFHGGKYSDSVILTPYS